MSTASFHILPLSLSRRDTSRFLRVPYSIYNGDPHWVAPLLMDARKVLAPSNPLFQHARLQLFIAQRGGHDVGRIAGIVEDLHNRTHNEQTAFWGFFESIDDLTVSQSLFDAAADWARSQGMNRLLGPMNPTSNDECGLLVDGFDSPPVIMMTYNPRYYERLVESAGFAKARDLYAYIFDIKDKPLSRMERISAGVRKREPELVLHRVTKHSLAADLGKVKEVYNAAWEENWGFVPMTDAELDFTAARLRPLIGRSIIYVAEVAGEAVGFLAALPDFNEAIHPLRGRVLTPKIFKAIPYLIGQRCPRIIRLVTLGFKKGFRQRGFDAVMFADGLKEALRMGYTRCEVSWVLEENVMVQRPVEVFDGTRYKTYRLYSKMI